MSIESLITNKPKQLTRKKNKDFDKRSLEHVIKILHKHGFSVEKNLKYLSRGVTSQVFIVDDKYVLKFTNYDEDAKSWAKLIGHNIPNVVKCIDVLLVGDYIKQFSYIIIQEFFKNGVNEDDLLVSVEQMSGYIYDNVDWTRGGIWEEIVSEYSLSSNGDKFIYTQNIFNQLYNGINKLINIHLDPRDVHDDNVRIDSDGVLKIIDF